MFMGCLDMREVGISENNDQTENFFLVYSKALKPNSHQSIKISALYRDNPLK